MEKGAIVRDDESVAGRATQLWNRQGTHQVVIHAILNLEYPVDEVILLALEIPGILGILDSAEDTEHACGCPAVTWAGIKPDEDQMD